jgi:TetR/AcrR family transcriptional regulator, cholesterol catabolism regulator
MSQITPSHLTPLKTTATLLSNERSTILMTSPLPTPRGSEAKLQHILRISSQVFSQQGFAGTSLRDISKATNVSLSGLYYYFQSKQHLLYLIQSKTFTYIIESLDSRLQDAHHPAERVRLLVLNHIDYFLSHPNEMKVLSHEEDALTAPFHEKVQAIKRRYYALAREIFDSLADEGLAPDINPRVAVLSLFGMMNWTYKWHKPGVDPDAQELTAAIVAIFLHGVLPPGADPKPVFVTEVQAGDHR